MSEHETTNEKVEGEKVRISLILAKGHDESLKVPSDPIAVPSTTRKKGLSAIVNHLLDRKVLSDGDSDTSDSDSDSDDEKLPALPFDFLLNNKLLRLSVEAAARRDGLSLEQAIEIKYFPARQAPEGDGESDVLPDWISVICSSTSFLFTGNCDGSIRVFSNSEQFSQRDIVKSHSGPIKCISCCQSTIDNEDSTTVATGSMDQTLLTHTFGIDGKLRLHSVYSGGHTSSINSVRLLNNNGNTSMASGDWDGGLCIWKVPTNDLASNSLEPSGKKRRGASIERAVQETSPVCYFKAHSNNISGIVWGFDSHNTLITSSWDHSIKSWDIETQNNIITLNGAKVATCIGRCHNSDVVATGHPDCMVRLWDMRSNSKNEGSVFDGSLRPSHKAWISAVEWSPVDPYVLSSASHDGTVKVWDIRSSVPLHTVKAHSKGSKALCLSFADGAIYSGGSDCVVKRFKFD